MYKKTLMVGKNDNSLPFFDESKKAQNEYQWTGRSMSSLSYNYVCELDNDLSHTVWISILEDSPQTLTFTYISSGHKIVIL